MIVPVTIYLLKVIIYTVAMDSLESDLKTIEESMHLYFQTVKRPQNWASLTAQAGSQIDRPAFFILHTLMVQPEHSRVQDLATRLGIEAPSITRKTQELEEAGYLRRVPDPTDRRAITLELTAKGRGLGEKVWKAQRAGVRKVLIDWPATEREQFVKLFTRFSQDTATYYKELDSKQTERKTR
jgi:DNA-binding MarR family transcriptional regulator